MRVTKSECKLVWPVETGTELAQKLKTEPSCALTVIDLGTQPEETKTPIQKAHEPQYLQQHHSRYSKRGKRPGVQQQVEGQRRSK